MLGGISQLKNILNITPFLSPTLQNYTEKMERIKISFFLLFLFFLMPILIYYMIYNIIIGDVFFLIENCIVICTALISIILVLRGNAKIAASFFMIAGSVAVEAALLVSVMETESVFNGMILFTFAPVSMLIGGVFSYRKWTICILFLLGIVCFAFYFILHPTSSHTLWSKYSGFLIFHLISATVALLCFELIQNYGKAFENQEISKRNLEISNANYFAAHKEITDEYLRLIHDIKSPLTCIYNFALMMEETEQNAEQQELTIHMINSNKMVLDIVNTQLQSKTTSNKQESFLHLVHIRTLVTQTMTIYEKSFKNYKNIHFTSNIAEEIPQILTGKPNLLIRCLTNILDNAVKHTINGEISISVTPSHKNKNITKLNFKITNKNGIYSGNAQDEQCEPSEKKKQIIHEHLKHSHGIGLAYIAQAIENEGGRLNMKHPNHNHTIVCFDLPFGYTSIVSL